MPLIVPELAPDIIGGKLGNASALRTTDGTDVQNRINELSALINSLNPPLPYKLFVGYKANTTDLVVEADLTEEFAASGDTNNITYPTWTGTVYPVIALPNNRAMATPVILASFAILSYTITIDSVVYKMYRSVDAQASVLGGSSTSIRTPLIT